MSEKISLHDRVAIEAMSAIIAKAAGADARPRAAALSAFEYADAFMAVRAERNQSADEQSLGAELRLLRQQRDEAQGQAAQLLAQVSSLRLALQPLYGFSASHERPLGVGGKLKIVSDGPVSDTQCAKILVALRELLGDPT